MVNSGLLASLHDADDAGVAVSSWPVVLPAGLVENADAADDSGCCLRESLHDADDAGVAVSSWPVVLPARLVHNADAAGVVG